MTNKILFSGKGCVMHKARNGSSRVVVGLQMEWGVRWLVGAKLDIRVAFDPYERTCESWVEELKGIPWS